MNMDELRGRIDAVDDELLRCFAERMDIAGDIARYKAEHGLPVLDERREREKLYAVSEKAPEELQSYAVSLYALLFELSRSRQNRLLGCPYTAFWKKYLCTFQFSTASCDLASIFHDFSAKTA